MVKIVPIIQPSFKIGLLKGKLIGNEPDFFEPTESEPTPPPRSPDALE
jgi:hypothetical protein